MGNAMSSTKAQFKAGWKRACEQYEQGEDCFNIQAEWSEDSSPFADGVRAAVEAISGYHASACALCAEYGITGDEYTALHNLTLDV